MLQAGLRVVLKEFNELRTKMKANCSKCHSQGFVGVAHEGLG